MDFLELKKEYKKDKFKFSPSLKFTGGDGGSNNVIYIDNKIIYGPNRDFLD